MFMVEPKTQLNKDQTYRLEHALKACNSIDMLPYAIAALNQFIDMYKLKRHNWIGLINGVKSMNGTSEDECLFMMGYMAKVFIDELDAKDN